MEGQDRDRTHVGNTSVRKIIASTLGEGCLSSTSVVNLQPRWFITIPPIQPKQQKLITFYMTPCVRQKRANTRSTAVFLKENHSDISFLRRKLIFSASSITSSQWLKFGSVNQGQNLSRSSKFNVFLSLHVNYCQQAWMFSLLFQKQITLILLPLVD